MERRILITHWVVNAWKTLCAPENGNLRNHCWGKTGCLMFLMTGDSSYDEKISPEFFQTTGSHLRYSICQYVRLTQYAAYQAVKKIRKMEKYSR